MEDMCNEDFIVSLKESIPTILLALHDIASKKRRQAKLMLRALCEKANSDPTLQEALVSITVACLAGQSETIRAGVVEALGLFAYALEDCEGLKHRFIRIVLLLDKHTPQMARSVVKFLRLTIQGVNDPETLQSCFDYFLKSIMSSTVARSACRIRIRTLIEKLGKRFGWENLEKMMPEQHIRLFRYIRRMHSRRVRKCQAKASKREGDAADSDSLSSSDDEERGGEVCMLEDDERPVDLNAGRLPLILQRRKEKKDEGVKLSPEGRLLVEEEESDSECVQAKEQHASASGVPKRVSLSDLAEVRDRHNALRKAKIAEKGGSCASGISRRGSRGMDVLESKTKRNRRKHELVGLTQFAPKKKNAFGDTKRANSDTDPFAYVRLNPSLVREKYKGNALASISKVICKTGEKAWRKVSSRGRNGIAKNLFQSKPPAVTGKKSSSKKKSIGRK